MSNEVSIWAPFLLYEFVELVRNAPQVERDLRNHLGDEIETFLPTRTKKISTKEFQVNLFDGYAFVKHDGTADFEERVKAVRGSYVETVLSHAGKISYVSGKEIEKYKTHMDSMVYPYIPEVDDMIEGVEGTFKSMVGLVVAVNLANRTADVKFKTRTREVLAANLSFVAMALKEDI